MWLELATCLPTVTVSTSYMIAVAIECFTLNVASPFNKYVDPYCNDAVRINSTVFVVPHEVTLITLAINGQVGEKQIRRSTV